MIITQRDFKVLDPRKTYEHVFYYQSWYSSIFLKNSPPDDNEESCCITFQVRKDRENKKYMVLANILMPNNLDSYRVMTHLKNLSMDFTNDTIKELPHAYMQNCVIVPANDGEANSFSAEAERGNVPIQRLFIENNGGSLEGLVNRAMNIAKRGKFYLVLNHKNVDVFRPMDERFLEMIIRYPSSDSYAMAYAWSQGIIYADRFMGIFDDEKKNVSKSVRSIFYGVDS